MKKGTGKRQYEGRLFRAAWNTNRIWNTTEYVGLNKVKKKPANAKEKIQISN